MTTMQSTMPNMPPFRAELAIAQKIKDNKREGKGKKYSTDFIEHFEPVRTKGKEAIPNPPHLDNQDDSVK